eukprot:c16755_g1_i1.p1 GENE.c16755_g1_i1~~c16755_g1_i1.p1  ORF type:complete len:529 (-),score=144.41 c16755_g1_i1:4-1506(-)
MADSGFLMAGDTQGTPSDLDGEDTYAYNPLDPAARDFVFSKIREGYLDNGIKTFWLDADEPEQYDMTIGNHFYRINGQWVSDVSVGMSYPREHQRMIDEGMAASAPQSKFLTLSRSAWAGSQRYSTALWSGDIPSTFEELSIQIRVLQSVMLSGIPWWTSDIGGYGGGDPQNVVFRQLIVRWFQFGAFCPLFRLHGQRAGGPPADECGDTNGDNEVWSFGDEAFAVISGLIKLRENLRSYVIRYAQVAVENGIPLVRPMFMEFPSDPECSGTDVENQFMFGPAWLVVPVTEYNQTTQSVYLPLLPAGQKWVYWYTKEVFDTTSKGTRVNVTTPLTEFPLFFISTNATVSHHKLTKWTRTADTTSRLCATTECETLSSLLGFQLDGVEGYVISDSDTTNVVAELASGKLKQLYRYELENGESIITTAHALVGTKQQNAKQLTNGFIYSNFAPGLLPLDLYFREETNSYVTTSNGDHQFDGFEWVQRLGYIMKRCEMACEIE